MRRTPYPQDGNSFVSTIIAVSRNHQRWRTVVYADSIVPPRLDGSGVIHTNYLLTVPAALPKLSLPRCYTVHMP